MGPKPVEEVPRKSSINKVNKEKEEAKEKLETEDKAWGTELSLGNIIG